MDGGQRKNKKSHQEKQESDVMKRQWYAASWKFVAVVSLILNLGFITCRFLKVESGSDFWFTYKMFQSGEPVWQHVALQRISEGQPLLNVLSRYPNGYPTSISLGRYTIVLFKGN
jgi:hypothetical protein